MNGLIKNLTNNIQAVKSLDTTEISFGVIHNDELMRLKFNIAKALLHFKPQGTAMFVNTPWNNTATRLTVVFIPDEDGELRIVDDNKDFDINPAHE